MKLIADEIRDFLARTGMTQTALSISAGVPCSTISNLVRGKRKGVHGVTQDALREAMRRLTTTPTTPPEESAPGRGGEDAA